MSNKFVTLSYKGIEKKVKFPTYYEDLLKIFLQEFNENRNKKFAYSYVDSEGDDNDIGNDTDLNYALEELNNNPNMKIIFQEINEEEKEEEKAEEKEKKEEENRVEEIHVRRNDSSQDESENFEENNEETNERKEIDQTKSAHNLSLMKQKKKENEKIAPLEEEEPVKQSINRIEEEEDDDDEKNHQDDPNKKSLCYNETPGASDSKIFPNPNDMEESILIKNEEKQKEEKKEMKIVEVVEVVEEKNKIEEEKVEEK